jgi:hypothetical protein
VTDGEGSSDVPGHDGESSVEGVEACELSPIIMIRIPITKIKLDTGSNLVLGLVVTERIYQRARALSPAWRKGEKYQKLKEGLDPCVSGINPAIKTATNGVENIFRVNFRGHFKTYQVVARVHLADSIGASRSAWAFYVLSTESRRNMQWRLAYLTVRYKTPRGLVSMTSSG